MVNLTNHFIVAGVAVCVGFLIGYRYADNSAQIEQLERDSLAYQQTISNLQNTLDTEHKWNDQAEAQTVKTAQDVADAEQVYKSAVSGINAILDRVHTSDTARQSATMPDTASTAGKSAKCPTVKCNCKNTEAFRRLSKELLIITKDCDIQNSYLKQCVGLYNTIRN
jgi:DNA repair exonuclease SbcCD ATPase subunit